MRRGRLRAGSGRACALALASLLATGCAGSASSTSVVTISPGVSPSGGATGRRSATVPATPASSAPATLRAGLAACPAPVSLSALRPLATLAGGPDDVTVTSSGRIWVTLTGGGRVVELDAAGRLLRSLSDVNAPEGIVPLPDGRLAVAEQGPDRVVILDPASGRTTPLLQLTPVAGKDGVDGLSVDGQDLVIPDSARGSVEERPLGIDTAPLRLVARGLGRPVAAAPAGDGTLLVADEAAGALLRVDPRTPGAHPATVARLSTPDEVLVEGGLAYVTELGAGRLDAVDAATGEVRPLVVGAPQPQGLAALPDGRLVLVDSERQVVVVTAACGTG